MDSQYDVCVDYDALCVIEEKLKRIGLNLTDATEKMLFALQTSQGFLAGRQFEKAQKTTMGCIDITAKTNNNIRNTLEYIDQLKELYSQAIYKFYQSYQNFVLYVFSDDIEWCRQNSTNLGFSYASDVVYVEGNTNGNNYIDLQLMSMCEGIVMSNSAFCYLAALLDKRLKVHITPTNREV